MGDELRDEANAEPAAPPRRDSGRAEFVPPDPKSKPPADELEFLRSTVGEAEAAAPPAGPKPKERKTKTEPPAPPAEPMVSVRAIEVPSGGSGSEAAGELPKPRGTGENRTLKCPECGTMNRATEWYCERCGSELAGV